MNSRHRITTTVSKKMRSQLDELTIILDTATDSESIRRAINVFHKLVTHPGKIILQTKDSSEVLMLEASCQDSKLDSKY